MSSSYAKFRKKVVTPIMQKIGHAQTINSQTITVTEIDAAGLVKEAHGTSVITDGGAGYAKGCVYTKTDAGGDGLYENIGTSSSCNFTLNFGGGGAMTPLAHGDIYVGSVGNEATAVAMSGDGTISDMGVLDVTHADAADTATTATTATSATHATSADTASSVTNGLYNTDVGTVTRHILSAAAGLKSLQTSTLVETTAAAYTAVFIAPATGSVPSIQFVGGANLATSDTNYIAFTVNNVTNSNAPLLAASDANTTKATGGSGLTQGTVRQLTMNATPSNLNVTVGDVLLVTYTVHGTLVNQVPLATVNVNFVGTT